MGPYLSPFRTGVGKDKKKFNIQNPCGRWDVGEGVRKGNGHPNDRVWSKFLSSTYPEKQE
jgi:hypothetical protein